jgi:hypothetical protein
LGKEKHLIGQLKTSLAREQHLIAECELKLKETIKESMVIMKECTKQKAKKQNKIDTLKVN